MSATATPIQRYLLTMWLWHFSPQNVGSTLPPPKVGRLVTMAEGMLCNFQGWIMKSDAASIWLFLGVLVLRTQQQCYGEDPLGHVRNYMKKSNVGILDDGPSEVPAVTTRVRHVSRRWPLDDSSPQPHPDFKSFQLRFQILWRKDKPSLLWPVWIIDPQKPWKIIKLVFKSLSFF